MPGGSATTPTFDPIEGTIDAFADRDPFPFYERLRAIGSPVWDSRAKAWLVLDFEQCTQVERDERIFANAYVFADDLTRRIKGGGANITLSRDREHDKLRRFHLKLLSPGSVSRFREAHIRPIVDFVADGLVGKTKADLFEDYAARIPPRVICSLLGVPFDDDAMMARILELNEEIVNFIASGYEGEALRDRALAASQELNETLLPYIRARRDAPGDDFISRVWQEAPAAGIATDEEAVLGLCRELYFAGSDTTVHGIANALYLLLADPGRMDVIRHDRGKPLSALIEESLRLYNVVQYRHRICMEESVLGDVRIAKGAVVILVHAAANRDPVKFACPAQIDLERRAPTDHLAFGQGSRSCVGSQLARVEMRIAIETLLDRFPDLGPDVTADPPRFQALYMRSMAPLHVSLERSSEKLGG
ncbi:cytochrome P450 [Novosphingobium sp. BL-52-GroH]|uniref:cytochrome P450 n=1 Tax=Novosphingobium sp. BL-52-GroH TaxID=3349877 RepID=UPI00384B22B7